MIKKFINETGAYIDWKQLKSLLKIDTFIDIGVGLKGTETMYRQFNNANLIFIDPIDEAKRYPKKISKSRYVTFIQSALGKVDGIEKSMKLQK